MEDRLVDILDRKLRFEREFETDAVAYLEVAWGRETYAVNALIRDLEKMRRGVEDPDLREPETEFEREVLVLKVRELADQLAHQFGLSHLISEK